MGIASWWIKYYRRIWMSFREAFSSDFMSEHAPGLVRKAISLNHNALDRIYVQWECSLLCCVCVMLFIRHCIYISSLETLSSIKSWIPFRSAIKQNFPTKIRHHLFQAGFYFEFWWLPAKYASFLFCEISSVSKNPNDLVFCFSSYNFSPQSTG